MPATEETWRSSKLLHVVFGVSSVALFLATLWMLAADHDREWKRYQRSFQHLDEWSAQSRAAEADSADYEARRQELQAALDAIQAELPDAAQVQEFLALGRTAGLEKEVAAAEKLWQSYADEPVAEADVNAERRKELATALQAVVARAKFVEDNLSRDLKFANADLDVARSNYKLGVDNALPPQRLADLEAAFHAVESRVEEARLAYQESRRQREQLQQELGRMQAAEATAAKALADHVSTLAQLQQTVVERAQLADNTLLTLPIVDPFGGPFKIQQLWLPQLTLNNNFKEVARFDRCITCHQGIDRTAAGSAVAPGYEQSHQVTLALATPEDALGLPGGLVDPARGDELLREHYGLQLSPHGVFDSSSVMVMVAWPRTPAALAGLQAGDVIEMINDVQILDVDLAYSYLLQNVEWGRPLQVRVRRGVPEPFGSHPRLDLFVGSASPHKMQDMGCTICHEGQGSATSFQWASHSPSTPAEQEDWTDEHGWFNNHHWIYPMRPERFEESSCLKCHHQVVELLPSERYPDPPAPKLMEGYDTIRQFGCFGCHEIVGWDGPQRRIGPDLRNEPAYAAAAEQLLIDSGLSDEERIWAEQVAAHPENTTARQRLAESIRADAALATAEESPRLSAASHALASIVGADDPTPGEFRRVGPSLRHLSSKVELEFLYRWVEKPADFRPSSKMPQFFGLWDHLTDVPKTDGSGQVVLDEHGQPEMVSSPARLESERFEPVEIRAVSEYLLHFSQPFDYLAPPAGDVAAPSAERGKLAFEVRGCLACHQQGATFAGAQATQGPDLSNLGSKLVGDRGRQWLYSWVREPNRYHARTVMPDLFLTVEAQADGTLVDPAADITEYLLAQQGWQAQPLPELDSAALADLAEMYLRGAFSQTQAARYAKEGIPQELDGELTGDERLLLSDGPIDDDQRLLYVGRRTIARLGCAGCHDIPGFEDAKPIGTGLNDWGRKEASKLAFEQILSYPHLPGNGRLEAHGAGDHTHDAGAHGHGPSLEGLDQDTGFYVESLLAHERTGFIWQKLREPRSYDYRQAENKPYTDRLRMPLFTFSLDEAENAARREAAITFVLGLVAEPPAARYVYQPPPQQQAIVQGQKVLERFNCAGCHTLNMERWQIEYDPEEFESPGDFTDYAFLAPHFTPEALAQSQRVDRRGLGQALLTGWSNPQVAEDDDGNPLYFFGLWKPAAINGEVWAPGGLEVPVPEAAIERQLPPVGGEFARLIYPSVLAQGLESNPNLKANDVWGWVPPPLLGEGAKVQPQWLHDFLLDPFEIRPAAVLRMPKFNLSSAEATALVEYFAAIDGLTKPYEYDERTRSAHLAEAEAAYRAAAEQAGLPAAGEASDSAQLRLEAALRLITDNNYCVKCHLIGDFAPQGSRAAMAPRLDRIHQRLRPEFLRQWIANPVRLLPFTGMPVNFPPDKPAAQELYVGDSLQQVDAVVDLLLNYDRLMKERQSIQAMVKPAPPPGEEPPAADENAADVEDSARATVGDETAVGGGN